MLLLTRCSVIVRRSAAGQDRRRTGRGNSRSHVQQRLDDVALEDSILLPQIQDSHYLTLEKKVDDSNITVYTVSKASKQNRTILSVLEGLFHFKIKLDQLNWN